MTHVKFEMSKDYLHRNILEIQVWGLRDIWAGDLEFISMKMFFKFRAIDDMI